MIPPKSEPIPGSMVLPLQVVFEASPSFSEILQQIRSSLLISTYQAGRLVGVGVARGALDLSFHSFARPMGLGVSRDWIALGAGSLIWFLRSTPEIASLVEPAGKYDACFMARTCHVTSEINSHELGYAGDQLWVVNTLFSCLCTLNLNLSFQPQWKPPFISAIAPEDRCHLNGLAIASGRPRYATALGETDTRAGWRPGKAKGGCLIDIEAHATIARGFSMPHSPRLHDGQVWLLDSGTGRVMTVNLEAGTRHEVISLPGYLRGLCFAGPYAFVGLSKIRPTSMFDDVPLSANKAKLKCGVAVVDLARGILAGMFEFLEGVDEIFAVEVLQDAACPAICGPNVLYDSNQPIYAIPGDWLSRAR